ncbi:type IV pilin [Methanolacinia petrolearia]|uniref:type IV pilin n=1 Tax=Methanolacinia petrolearia TaxID=54120 RepID=UPI003BAB702B
MKRSNYSEEAVSPVVGVMLMLVVTIIIAAVVSVFASGLADTSSKAPQVSIAAELRNGACILIDHKGGDVLDLSSIDVRTYIPSGNYADMSYNVDLSDSGNVTIVSEDPDSGLLQPGDSLKIKWDAAFGSSSYGMMAPSIGEPVDIEIYDSSSGKTVGKTRVTNLP